MATIFSVLLRADSISSPRGPPPPEINGVRRFGELFKPPLGCNMTKCGPTKAVVIGVSVVVVVDELPSMMMGGTGVEGRRGRSVKAAGLEAADDVKKTGELLLLQLLLLVALAEPPPPLLVVSLICSPLADCQTARSMESGVNASSLAE